MIISPNSTAGDLLNAVSQPTVRADIELGQMAAVRDVIQMLSLVLEDNDIDHLVRLVDNLPTTVRSDGVHIRQQLSFISSVSDLRNIGAFLDNLSAEARS